MRVSLIFAFISALILHSVLAFVELNAFKIPVSTEISPKTLTMDIVVPQSVKKTSKDKYPLIAVRETIKKKRIPAKVKQKQVIEPKAARKKTVQTKISPATEVIPEKHETVDGCLDENPPETKKKEDDFFEEDVFVPDMVDIPRALPEVEDTSQRVTQENVSVSSSAIPIADAHPIYKSNTTPPYPLLARKRGYQGTVFLEVLVGINGKAISIKVARSSGYSILDKAAIKGVSGWLFHPAKRGDELIEMWVKIPVRFTLN